MRRINKIPLTISTTATNNKVGTITVPVNGYIRKIKVKSPAAVDTSATLATTIADGDGDALDLASGFTGQAVNATVKQTMDTQTQPNPLQIPVAETLTITATLNQNQTTPRTVIVTLYVDSLPG